MYKAYITIDVVEVENPGKSYEHKKGVRKSGVAFSTEELYSEEYFKLLDGCLTAIREREELARDGVAHKSLAERQDIVRKNKDDEGFILT